MARQLVSGREEIAFERESVRVNVANHHGIACGFHKIIGGKKVAGFEIMRDVVQRFAFANRKGNLVDFALREFPENLAATYGMIEQIFSRLERTPWMPPRINFECGGAAHYAVTLKNASYAPAGRAVRYGNEHASAREPLVWLRDAIPSPGPSSRHG